ncbi:hypothetical protein PR048_024641 [Dryococelus australis]|uniref:Uncharacterized protein n=1 Tax=Dryococelus australis TaxID=614101 RepID=A0ABQ9GP47_9NEOP|nr:hypothetical protein PR048_024641 [Dryococelus australis]
MDVWTTTTASFLKRHVKRVFVALNLRLRFRSDQRVALELHRVARFSTTNSWHSLTRLEPCSKLGSLAKSYRVSEEIWIALNIKVSMEQCRNEGVGETGDPREDPSTNGIVQHNSHMQKSDWLIAQPPWPLKELQRLGYQHKHYSLLAQLGAAPVTPTSSERVSGQTPVYASSELGSIPSQITPGFSQVEIVPDDAVGRQVFLGISCFRASFHYGTAPYSYQSPSSAVKTTIRGITTTSYRRVKGVTGVGDAGSGHHGLPLERCSALVVGWRKSGRALTSGWRVEPSQALGEEGGLGQIRERVH